MKTTRLLLLYIGIVAAMFVVAGCASSKKAAAAMPADVAEAVVDETVEDEEPEFVERIAEPDPTEPTAMAEPEPEIVNVDSLLEAARAACADGSFDAADSMIKRAARYLARDGFIAPRGKAQSVRAGDAPPPPLPAEDSAQTEETAQLDGNADSATAALRDYAAEIISIYTELMPANFSLPDEISSVMFTQRLFDALMSDSLRLSHTDSVFISRLSSVSTTYDVPMVWNDRVRRAFIFYTRTRKDAFDRWLHRAGYYMPPMAQMFADSGLPRDLAYLPVIESAFNPHAYSRAHAAGIWQFIPSTGRNYGLRQNYWLDERRDPLKSTEAAIKYLRKLYGDFGDWHIALASYNCGENGMARAIRKAGGVRDYWKLKLPKETMNYVPLYLATVMIAKNPEVFDFAIQDSVIFDYDTVSVNDCLEMKTIAEGIDIELDSLKRLNPQILHWCTPPDMQNVRLYLPKGYADTFNEFYQNLPDEKKTKFYRYKVRQGDNLQSIARNFRVEADALREFNNMQNNSISQGQFLIIPIPVNDTIPAGLAAYMNQSERQRPAARGGRNTRNRPVVSRDGKKLSYKVRTGETLYSISQMFGVSVDDLMGWNYLSSPRSLKAEQTLVIYLQDGAGTPAVTAPSSQQRVRGNASEHTGKRLVRQGDTLYSIALELGLTVSELAKINGLDAKRPLIYPGDVLVYTPRAQSGGSDGSAQ